MEFIIQFIKNVMLLLGFVGGGNAFPKPLSAKEEKFYLEKYASGDENAKNMLIEHSLRLVAQIA